MNGHLIMLLAAIAVVGCAAGNDHSATRSKFAVHQEQRFELPIPGGMIPPVPAIVLECRILQSHPLPPQRTVFFAEVLRTSVHPGVTDSAGRLNSKSREFFGMTAGNGEFWSLGRNVGNIGRSIDRHDIRY